tara:strand:- start:23584 stop:23814 length:231 start_codon:yes stop_codon:yes gene_type:complete
MAKKSIGLDTPPERPTHQGGNKLDAQRIENELVPTSHKLPAELVKYLRILSIQTGREQRDLLAEALELLREKYGAS